ncbi:hypothetical protein BLA6863_06771 [Burkholderia lata]|uniref:Uncharacterized protein n=1 Tax=Burkholderia lata (strain ATCC 17760 / DSM 23089 / LMG 22485 / NCIMB 9086 / R18194 / 383) TaxID=482957 RepID=A0A6P2RKJ8_BURL3|nr:hypothetical protein BLA6863_06771 [Burkholderia lata]
MNLDQSRIGSCPAYGRILSRFVRDRGRCPGAACVAASHEPALCTGRRVKETR